MPTIRGSYIQSASGSSFTVPWPSGTQAGDLAVVFVGAALHAGSAVSGWTAFAAAASPFFWNGSGFSKTLDSGDISTGSVTVTLGDPFQTVIGIVIFVGAPSIRTSVGSRDVPPGTPVTLTTDSSPVSGDLAIYFGSNRGNSTDTTDRGTGLQTVSAANGSGVLVGEDLASGGAQTINFTYSPVGSGAYSAILIVYGEGSGGGGGPVIPVIVHHLRQQGIL
jgi:hypothetical protein